MLVRESINFERTGNVKKSLDIGYEAKIRKFFRDLDIPDADYTVEPNGKIVFKCSLDLSHTKITELPDNLIVNGYLCLTNSNISKLPNNLKINDDLYLLYTKIKELPDDLKVGDEIIVNSKQTELIDFIENSKFKNQLDIWEY